MQDTVKTAEETAGYCWPQSVLPGATVALYCSTPERHAVEVVRQGARDETVATFEGLPGRTQAVPADVAVNGCGWAPTLEIPTDPAWPSGFYLVRIRTDSGAQSEAFFVLRARRPGKALLVLSTSTWAAYNDWHGPSFYTGGHVVSTRRPLPKGFLHKPDPHRFRVAHYADLPPAELQAFLGAGHSRWCMAAGWCNAERLFAAWAEDQGFALDYATSQDLDADPNLLDGYAAYLSVGHDEYWSKAMRDQVEGFVAGGGRAAFFSGNTAFWQVRFAADYGQVIGYKLDFAQDPCYGTADEHLVSTMWSDPVVGRPENTLTGVSFTRGGYAHVRGAPYGSGGYTVWRPGHWAFAGCDRLRGDVLGAGPVVVGYECDGCELALENGLPVATGRDGTPDGFTVLATAPAHLWTTEEAPPIADGYVGELNWVAERLGGADVPEVRERYANGYAVMGAFEQGRGEVFTVGCTDWAYGLADANVARITQNVLRRFGVPAGLN